MAFVMLVNEPAENIVQLTGIEQKRLTTRPPSNLPSKCQTTAEWSPSTCQAAIFLVVPIFGGNCRPS